MNCPHCGNLVTFEGAKFCNVCGKPLAGAAAPPPQGPQAPQQQAPTPPQPYPQQSPPPQQYSQQAPPAPPYPQQAPGYGGPPPQQGWGAPQGGAPQGAIQNYGSSSYRYEIHDRPSYSTLTVYLEGEQTIRAEAGAMVAQSANVELQSQMSGGIMGALKRAVTQESIFQNFFTARGGPGEVIFAPAAPGDIVALDLQNQALSVQSSSYLCGHPGLQMETKLSGFKGFFSGEGLFMIQMAGTGALFLSSYGSIIKKTLRPGERYVVDTGHIVAFESQMQYSLRKASQAGWLRSIASGEGVVAEYVGPGDIYIQSRNLAALAGILAPLFPKQTGSGGFSIGGFGGE